MTPANLSKGRSRQPHASLIGRCNAGPHDTYPAHRRHLEQLGPTPVDDGEPVDLGFTRGLAFAGRFAFVGLSQVREASTFGGLPLTGRLEDRSSGVWVVDLQSGEVVAFVRFQDAVQEIFDVAVLCGRRFPELAEPGSEAAGLSFVVPALA